jgi:hypothetical protein
MSISLLLFSLFLSSLKVLISGSPSQGYEGLIIVVGDVTNNSARVLFDSSTPVLVHGEVEGIEYEATIDPSRPPLVLLLHSLLEGTSYQIKFSITSGDQTSYEVVTFRTVDNDGEQHIIVVSCDRSIEDGDTKFLDQLSASPDGSFTAMIHIGDQIYADKIKEMAMEGSTVEDLLEAFRAYYRKGWGNDVMRGLLRRG